MVVVVVYKSTCVSRQPQLTTGGFCWSKVLQPIYHCRWQLLHLYWEKMLEVSSVLLPTPDLYQETDKWDKFQQQNKCIQIKFSELFHFVLLTKTADLGLIDDGGMDERKTPLSTHQITNTFTHHSLARFLSLTLSEDFYLHCHIRQRWIVTDEMLQMLHTMRRKLDIHSDLATLWRTECKVNTSYCSIKAPCRGHLYPYYTPK